MPSSTPGMDLVAPSAPGSDTAPEGPPLLMWVRIALNNRFCFPAEWSRKSVVATPRPTFWPGEQNVTSDLPQTGCVNDTASPWLNRCWAVRRHYNDVGTSARAVGSRGVPEPSNYLVRALDTALLCSAVMPMDCITTYTPLGCYYRYFPRVHSSPPAAPTAQQRFSDHSAQLGAALGGGLGGAVLFVVIATIIARRNRRRGRGSAAADNQLTGVGSGDALEDVQSDRKDQAESRSAFEVPSYDKLCCPADWGSPRHWLARLAAMSHGRPLPAPPARAATDSTTAEEAGMEAAVVSARARDKEGVRQGTKELDGEAPNRTSGDEALSGEATGTWPRWHQSDLLNPVTAQTPHRPDMALLQGGEPQSAQDEVRLLPDCVRGKGSFGHVVEGIYQGQQVAVKLVADVHQWCSDPDSLVLQFAQEVEVLGRCRHPNVVRLLAACLTPPRLCLVMELMETSLEQLLYARQPHSLLPLPMVLHIAREIARGLEYLHPTIVHRDLKPGNVLVSVPWSESPIVKISDFGLSRLRSTVVPTETPAAGTPAYLAPEGFDASNFIITHQADIYSLAIILWEMLVGEQPWRGCTVIQVAHRVLGRGVRLPLRCLPSYRCPHKLKSLIGACWDGDPQRRPAAAEVAKTLTLITQEVEWYAREEAAVAAAAAATATDTDANADAAMTAAAAGDGRPSGQAAGVEQQGSPELKGGNSGPPDPQTQPPCPSSPEPLEQRPLQQKSNGREEADKTKILSCMGQDNCNVTFEGTNGGASGLATYDMCGDDNTGNHGDPNGHAATTDADLTRAPGGLNEPDGTRAVAVAAAGRHNGNNHRAPQGMPRGAAAQPGPAAPAVTAAAAAICMLKVTDLPAVLRQAEASVGLQLTQAWESSMAVVTGSVSAAGAAAVDTTNGDGANAAASDAAMKSLAPTPVVGTPVGATAAGIPAPRPASSTLAPPAAAQQAARSPAALPQARQTAEAPRGSAVPVAICAVTTRSPRQSLGGQLIPAAGGQLIPAAGDPVPISVRRFQPRLKRVFRGRSAQPAVAAGAQAVSGGPAVAAGGLVAGAASGAAGGAGNAVSPAAAWSGSGRAPAGRVPEAPGTGGSGSGVSRFARTLSFLSSNFSMISKSWGRGAQVGSGQPRDQHQQ